MRKSHTLIALLATSLVLAGCGKKDKNSTTPPGTESGGETSWHVPTSEEADRYVERLAETSEGNHLYYHYYRFKRDYNGFDVWAWPYYPTAGQGYRFDWQGRTTSTDRLSATGEAKIDEFGYAVCDIDLTKTYDAGWDDQAKKMGGKEAKFLPEDGNVDGVKVGLQIVRSETRLTSTSFWENDGGNQYFELNDYAFNNADGTKSYHIFVVQDSVSSIKANTIETFTGVDLSDPFRNDAGQKVTFGNDSYSNADWNDKPIQATAEDFLNEAGIGYQIMVSSFADSDGDGTGDIYGIETKLDYLEALGVKVLWLTPIQLSDSYHGYDISDYLKVDPKFGSKVSPAGEANQGRVTTETAKADYKSLLDAAHERGMYVVMDLVLNHTSTTNVWFVDSAQLSDTMRGYYQWGNHDTQAEDINEGNFWYPYGSHVYSYYAKFGSSMPELNYAYADTRTAVETMALNWCEFGVDGFRMDAVKHIFMRDEIGVDQNDTYVVDDGGVADYSSDLTKNLNFWKELNYSVKQRFPNAFFVGENFDGHAYHVAPYYEGFDSLFDFYSYFNLTTVAADVISNEENNAFKGNFWLASVLGAWQSAEEDRYSASSDTDLAGSGAAIKYGGGWNIRETFDAYNQYRTEGQLPSDADGYGFINGAFTSNHDIARAINRVAGQSFTKTGLDAQGEVSPGIYSYMDELSTVVEITELMLPGLTWIYYGDELGMTGNFPDGTDAKAGYADLAYRQPMKWTQGGQVGDGSMTTGYPVTGAEFEVEWDDTNRSTFVAPASAQVDDPDSHFGALSKFAKAKNATPALIKGKMSASPINGGQYSAALTRTLGSDVYTLAVNYDNQPVDVALDGEIIAAYRGATKTRLPARSAILVKGTIGDDIITERGYSLRFSDGRIPCAEHLGLNSDGFDEYKITALEVEEGDVFSLYDLSSEGTWAVPVDGWSFDGTSAISGKWRNYLSMGDGSYIALQDFTADVYIKIKMGADQIFFDLEGDAPPIDPSRPTEGFGFIFSDDTFMAAAATGTQDAQGRTQYLIENAEFSEGDVFALYDFEHKASWVIDIDSWSFGAQGSEETVAQYLTKGSNSYTVVQDFVVDAYIKLKDGDDQLYFGFKTSPTDPTDPEQPTETGFGIYLNDATPVKGISKGVTDGFDEYVIRRQHFTSGDTFSLYNYSTGDKWTVALDGYSFGGTSADDTAWQDYLTRDGNHYVVEQDFIGKLYIKLKSGADQLYMSLCGEWPEEATDLPTEGYGFLFSDNQYLVGTKFKDPSPEGHTQYYLYATFHEGDVFRLANFEELEQWVVAINPYSFDGQSSDAERVARYIQIVDGKYVAQQSFEVEVYLQLKAGDDQIYFGVPLAI